MQPSCLVRPETPQDIASIASINRLAFHGEAEAGLVKTLRATTPAPKFLSLVAEWQRQPVGHTLFTPIQIQTESETKPAWALAPMAVLPEYQRKGVGTDLVRAGLARCVQAGPAIVIVLGHPHYYPRFGFEPASRWGLRCPFPAPDEAFMALALKPGALDGVVGDVEYPPAFHEAE